jgi:putative heme-binding domain-containing protein
MKINPQNAKLGAAIIANDTVPEFQRRIARVLGEFPGDAINKALGEIETVPEEVEEAVVNALAGSSSGKDIVFRKVSEGKVNPRALLSARTADAMANNATPRQQAQFKSLTAELSKLSVEKQTLIDDRLTSFAALDKMSLSPDSGKAIFAQNCSACHKLGGQLSVGPQLDGIGNTGAAGLIEKIIDPNRNISEGFRNYTVTLKDGTLKSGLFRRDEGEVKVFADITGTEFKISKQDIAQQKPSQYTLMPDSFGKTIKERDFYQLVNYLLTL